MSERNGWWAADVAAVVTLAGVAWLGVRAGAPDPVRVVLVLPLVVFLPGYALTAALFPARSERPLDDDRLGSDGGLRDRLPKNYELSTVERLVLSVTLSVGVVPLVALAVNVAAPPLAAATLVRAVAGATVALSMLALVRRVSLPPERRYSVAAGGARPAWLSVGTALGLLVALSGLGVAVVAPPGGAAFTEFYVVTGDVSGDDPSMYPHQFTAGQSRQVTVAAANREGRPQEYAVVAVLQRPTGDGWKTAERVGTKRLSVAAGETGRAAFDVSPSTAGDARLVFRLYRGDPPADPSASAYRTLELRIDVTTPSVADAGTAPVTPDLAGPVGVRDAPAVARGG